MSKTLTGVIHVTGEHDVGKTTFALECGAAPERICFLDGDSKGRATVDELRAVGVEFGAYHDLVTLGIGLREVEYHEEIIALIDSIPQDKFDAIIWDTWTRFAESFHPYVVKNPSKFRLEWSRMGQIKGAQQWKEAQHYEAQIIETLQVKAPTVILVTHLKAKYLNNADTGKKIPAASKTLIRVPRFRIWLRQNPSGSPVPIGLCLKRIDRKENTDRGLRTISILPRKLVPRAEERSLWDTIWRYWDNPVDIYLPTPDETPNEYELSILDGTLTEDQKHTLHLMLESGMAKEKEPEPLSEEEKKTIAKDMEITGANFKAIADELKVPVSEVIKLLS